MKLNFMESGIDSLKKGFTYLYQYELTHYNNPPKSKSSQRFFYLKDAILMIQHGIEILFKQLIHRHSEYLVFSQIDDNVKKALREKKERGLDSVFEGQFKHKIHTITFIESIERLKILPNVKIGAALERKVRELELYRNIIMHSQPHLNEQEINVTFDGLADELDTFFYSYLGKSYKTISGYSSFVSSFKKFQTQLGENNFAVKALGNEVFLEAIRYAGISMGNNELKRITDIDKCTRFIEKMFSGTLKFGTDICNGHCWGDVTTIQRIENECFRMMAYEDKIIYDFRFRSMILYFPQLSDDRSPIVIFESEDLNPELYPQDIPEKDFYGILTAEYLIFDPSGKAIRGEKAVGDFHDGHTLEYEAYKTYFRIYDRGLFCFLNIQGLRYKLNFRKIIQEHRLMDGKDFEIAIREVIATMPDLS